MCKYPLCDRQFAQKANLKIHEEKHSTFSIVSRRSNTPIIRSESSLVSPVNYPFPMFRRIFKISVDINNMKGNSIFEIKYFNETKVTKASKSTPSTYTSFTPEKGTYI